MPTIWAHMGLLKPGFDTVHVEHVLTAELVDSVWSLQADQAYGAGVFVAFVVGFHIRKQLLPIQRRLRQRLILILLRLLPQHLIYLLHIVQHIISLILIILYIPQHLIQSLNVLLDPL